ncbi:MAG: SDR family oxidoreductase [Parvularculaceae bacterium]
MNQIIVTGASGQFGRAAAALLLEKISPSRLILTSRTPERLSDFAKQGADVRYADFDRPETLSPAFKGGDRMLLISTARVGTRVGQHRNAIEAAAKLGVKQIAYTSVLGAATPGHPALVTRDHRATEEIIEASGVAGTFLRDSQYTEAVSDVIAPVAIMRGNVPGSAGDGRVAFVSRADCVACAAAVLTTPGHENKAYDLTGPALHTFPETIALISRIAGKPIDYVRVTDDDMFAYFDEMGAPRHASDITPDGPIPWSSDDMVTFEQAIREGYFDVLTGNVEKLTGKKPRSLETVLREAAARWPK